MDRAGIIMKKNKTELKECCTECGFPIDIERRPMIIKNDVFSLSHYMTNTCKSCGHQKDGISIPVVYDLFARAINQKIDERKKIIKFFHKFHHMSKEERKEVAVSLYQGDDKPDEPYSWNVVWEEVINDTEMSRVLLNNIELKE